MLRPWFSQPDGKGRVPLFEPYPFRSAAAAAAKSFQLCPTLCDPHRRQPTSLPRPRDSPGKNTGVGCHFLLQCMKVKSESEVDQLCPIPSDPMDCSPPGSSVHGIFPGKSMGVQCHCLLQPLQVKACLKPKVVGGLTVLPVF